MADSILMQAMLVIQTRIRALNLTGIDSDNVLIMKVPRDTPADLPATNPFPCIMIAPFGSESLNAQGGTNLSHDIGYPILIGLVDSDQQDQQRNFDRNLYWREQIIDKIHQCDMGITAVRSVVIEPGQIVDPGGWNRGKWISGLTARVLARKRRIP